MVALECFWCRWLCNKEIEYESCDRMSIFAAEVVCKFEKAFPPSFFDCQIHLLVHLPREIKLCGPVHARWMFFLERYLLHLKRFGRNVAHPEGSICEGYVQAEAMFYCRTTIQHFGATCRELWGDGRHDYEKDKHFALMGATKRRNMTPVQFFQVSHTTNVSWWYLSLSWGIHPSFAMYANVHLTVQVTNYILHNHHMAKWVSLYDEEKARSRPGHGTRFASIREWMRAKINAFDGGTLYCTPGEDNTKAHTFPQYQFHGDWESLYGKSVTDH